MNHKEEKRNNKLFLLNSNLKNEIFDFLRFKDLITQINRVDKKFLFALINRISLKYIKANFCALIGNLDFYLDKITNIKDILLEMDLSEEYCSQIITYLLMIKFKNEYILDLSFRDLGTSDDFMIKVISNFIKGNNLIVKLFLENNGLGIIESNTIKYLSEALIKNESLQDIYLNENSLGFYSDNIKHLSDVLSYNSNIISLYLSSNNLGDNLLNMKYLSQGLIVNKSIQYLDLSLNYLGVNYQNMFYLSEIIKFNHNIKEIFLNNNEIAKDKLNVDVLAKAIEINESLNEINLNSNNFGSDFDNVRILLTALKNNTRKFNKIKTIFLRCNYIESNRIYEKYLEEELENEPFIIINY